MDEEEETFTTAKTQVEGFDGTDGLAVGDQEGNIGGRRSTLPFGKTNKSVDSGLGVRGLFMLNLIKHAFIE